MEFDKEKTAQWIEEYCYPSVNCPTCKGDEWMLLDKVWRLTEWSDVIPLSNPSVGLPVVALLCTVCGHLIFFNAILVGAIEKPDIKE